MGGFDGRDIAVLGEVMGDEDEEMEDLYLMGLDDDEIGARRFGKRRMIRAKAGRQVFRQVPKGFRKVARAVMPADVPEAGPRYIPLPFPAIQFVNAGALVIQTIARTQKPFKGVRLVIVEARSAATVVGLLTLTQFAVGTEQQRTALNPIPAGAFGPGAFQVDLALTPVKPGVDVTIEYTLSITPPVGETLDVATMILGLAIAP